MCGPRTPSTPLPPRPQGLIFTAGSIYRLLHALNIPIHVQEVGWAAGGRAHGLLGLSCTHKWLQQADVAPAAANHTIQSPTNPPPRAHPPRPAQVCVFTAPLFSALCALACYGLVAEARGRGAGMLAAAMVGMVPSYISRSVGGSFDNEGVAIFALVNVFFLFVKARVGWGVGAQGGGVHVCACVFAGLCTVERARGCTHGLGAHARTCTRVCPLARPRTPPTAQTLNTGSLLWATCQVLAYLYMVMSWGGYSFVINLLPIYCLACIVTGRLSARLYVAFAPLVVLGTLMAGECVRM